ncbi:epidermal growth factor-like protein 7 [Liolophura sinensis]|uniref:epidermal growth factor-like protein 7 n=1 Tax=Liolophura sinensis TaxID=3198878 RepID=UPI00315977EE
MQLFVLTFCLLACLSVKALSPSGQNVCRHTRIESYTVQERYYTKCGWFNWGRCTRHRNVVRTRTAVDYRCCSGWNSADNIHCKRAICTGSAPGTCPNGGVCIRPTVCTCRKGFDQPNCAGERCATALPRGYVPTGERVCDLEFVNVGQDTLCLDVTM